MGKASTHDVPPRPSDGTQASARRSEHRPRPGTRSGRGAARANAAADQPELRNANSSLDLAGLLEALQAVHAGDFSVRLPGDRTGIEGKIADAFNQIIASNQRMLQELARIQRIVGPEGKTRQRARFGHTAGAWGAMESSIDTLFDDLIWPTTEVTRAVAAVARGDLLTNVRLDVDGRPLEGEFMRSAVIVNTMIRKFGVVTDEVTRGAREVGIDGKLNAGASDDLAKPVNTEQLLAVLRMWLHR